MIAKKTLIQKLRFFKPLISIKPEPRIITETTYIKVTNKIIASTLISQAIAKLFELNKINTRIQSMI